MSESTKARQVSLTRLEGNDEENKTRGEEDALLKPWCDTDWWQVKVGKKNPLWLVPARLQKIAMEGGVIIILHKPADAPASSWC